PWNVLGPVVLAQWIAIAIFATVVRHNGWLFYQGGDQTFFYTDAWALGRAEIPQSQIGYAWSYVLIPLTWIFGPNLLAALPALILLQVLVLQPIAIAAVYGIASRVAGRAVGYTAAALWVVTPFLVIPLWDPRYHAKYVEQFLPQALGLTGLGDFPSMVAVLVAAYFCLRSFDTRAPVDGVLGGLAAGFAIGMKPANALFLAAPLVGFTLARRFRPALGFALGLAPGVIALALWKQRGLGYLPIFQPETRALAAGTTPFITGSLSDNLNLSWQQLVGPQGNLAQLREFFWSPRATEWVAVAGAIGIARHSIAKAAFLSAWFLSFFLIKGMSPGASMEAGTFLRLFLPGFPPFLLFAAAIPLLLPGAASRLARRFAERDRGVVAWRSRPVIAAAAAFGIVPLLLMFVASPVTDGRVTKLFLENVVVPVDDSFRTSVREAPDGQHISWTKPEFAGVNAFYRVYRARYLQIAYLGGTGGIGDPTLPLGVAGIRCLPRTAGASDCRLEMQPIGTARGNTWLDPDRPLPEGRWSYRVGLVANWIDDPNIGDLVLLSRPVTVSSAGKG
ncbi:MAG: glycosyltransferase family 39 protein, partial [Actinomycetota bacterium]|nr:glycosyltransferase family 39 protein [Actinomycetota bacterium]